MPNIITLATKALQEAIQSGVDTLTSRLTAGRASNLDNLDAKISSRSSHSPQDVANLINCRGIKSVQRGETIIEGRRSKSSISVSISRVNTSKSFIISTNNNDYSGATGDTNVTAVIANGTTLKFTAGATDGDKEISWEVVEFE